MGKINIAELLKDCPKGMELDCTMWDNLYFDRVENDLIYCYYELGGFRNGIMFFKNGCYTAHKLSKCVIFPKGKTTLEGFQRPFKEGDIIVSKYYDIHLLRTKDSSYFSLRSSELFDHRPTIGITVNRLATEEEKQKLFDAIKANGYKWNTVTKTLEKLIVPKFKVGDIVQDEDAYKVKITEINIEDKCFGYESIIAKGIGSISFSEQDNWELVEKYYEPYKEETMEEEILTIDFTKDQKIADEVEVILGDYEFVLKDGKTYFVKKKPKYPKTYEECCKVLLLNPERASFSVGGFEYKRHDIVNLQKLLICRDAYWKILGNWKPNFKDMKQSQYTICCVKNDILCLNAIEFNRILSFPTKEMRDVFYENFKDLIEECKELL